MTGPMKAIREDQAENTFPMVDTSEIQYDIAPIRHRTPLIDQVLTRDEFLRLIQAANYRGKVILCLGVLGLRATEIGQCKASWIDFAQNLITIPSAVAKKGHSRRVHFGFLPFSQIIGGYFSIEPSLSLVRSAVWKAVKVIARRAGHKKPLTVHGLRATGATWAADKGYSAQAIQEMFGWNHLRTAEYYIKSSGRTGIKESLDKGGLL